MPLAKFMEERQKQKEKLEEVHESAQTIGGVQKKDEGQVVQMGRKVDEVGRNDPCPCGSGKKYKKCHGK